MKAMKWVIYITITLLLIGCGDGGSTTEKLSVKGDEVSNTSQQIETDESGYTSEEVDVEVVSNSTGLKVLEVEVPEETAIVQEDTILLGDWNMSVTHYTAGETTNACSRIEVEKNGRTYKGILSASMDINITASPERTTKASRCDNCSFESLETTEAILGMKVRVKVPDEVVDSQTGDIYKNNNCQVTMVFINPGQCESGSYPDGIQPQYIRVKNGYAEFLIYGPNVHIVTYLGLDCCIPEPVNLSGGSW
ncbi:MAG: hypothetical protein GXO30_05435 [Epsilonproteobacteria bacterium]|nr:hypothetical protein [Campylobacterota bacterium]